MLVAVVVAGVALNEGTALGTGGTGPAFQAAPPTAATVPPERTVPRITAARKTVKKKVVRKPVTTVKKAKTTTKTTVKGATTVAGSPTTTVFKPLRATVSGAGTYVAVRAEPDPKSALLRRIPDGTVVSIRCQVVGVAVSDPGAGRKSAVWNHLVAGGYITNMYTTLYVDGETKPAAGRTCSGSSGSSGGETSAGTETGTVTATTGTSGKIPAKPVITAVS